MTRMEFYTPTHSRHPRQASPASSKPSTGIQPAVNRYLPGTAPFRVLVTSIMGMSAWNFGSWALAPLPAAAQIASDGSLGTLVNGTATDSCLAAVCSVTGGVLSDSGKTLLHSFNQFSLQSGTTEHSALFIDPGVDDIVVRVTGGTDSLIDGTIRTSENSRANLFLVNPNGLSFGPKAQLDLGGAFMASTAHKIIFDNGVVLAANEETVPTGRLLTVSAPIGLGFSSGANAPITVQGSGHFLTFGSPATPDAPFVNRIFQQPSPSGTLSGRLPPVSALAVQSGKAISLIANGITLEGGNLSALGGHIELGSINAGTVGVQSSSASGSLAIDYSEVETFADISLTGRSLLEVSDDNPGDIVLRGANLSINESSAVLAETLATQQSSARAQSAMQHETATGGVINLFATDDIQVSDFATPPPLTAPPFYTYLSVDVAPGTTGVGGDINLRSRNLNINNGAQLSANTFGAGEAGQLQITVDETLSVEGIGTSGPSGLFAVADALGSGDAGNLALNAKVLKLQKGAQILTTSDNQGASGNITINADRVDLIGTSEPIQIFSPNGVEKTIVEQTQIQSTIGEAPGQQGGDVVINARKVLVADGAEVVTGTVGAGDSGAIAISADDITVTGFSPLGGPSAIFTAVGPGATGNGGKLALESTRLAVVGGAQVSTGTLGAGKAGDLRVRSDAVRVSGQTAKGRSGLFATAIGGTGAGGNLELQADTLQVRDGATLSVGNFPSSSEGNPFSSGRGPAGDLRVSARQILLSDRSILNADTATGDRGNITLQTDALILRQGSRITTNATGMATGGNINIEADEGVVVAVPDENSDITANAVFGDGGSVNITAQRILGIEARLEPTELSDITASSEFGLAGETRVEALNTDIRGAIIPLPSSTDVPVVATGCSRGTSSRFVHSGRGGLGTSPYGVLNHRESLADVSMPSTLAMPSAAHQAAHQAAQETTDAPIEEAQGWSTNAQGEVVLVTAEQGRSTRCLSWQQ